MSDPAQIAAILTGAQRRAVLTDSRFFADQWKGYWRCHNLPQAGILHRYGLIQDAHYLSRPTELGLAVRAILEKGDG